MTSTAAAKPALAILGKRDLELGPFAVDEAHQAMQPFIDPNEMANIPGNGVYPPVAGGYSPLVVEKVQSRPYTPLFKRVYGPDVFTKYTIPQLYTIVTDAIAAFEASGEVLSRLSMPSTPWFVWACVVRWTLPDGSTVFGEHQDTWSPAALRGLLREPV